MLWLQLRRRYCLHHWMWVGVRMPLRRLGGLEVYSEGIEVSLLLEVRMCIVGVYRLPGVELFL